MNVRSTLAVTLLSLSIVAGTPAAYAGFQMIFEGDKSSSEASELPVPQVQIITPAPKMQEQPESFSGEKSKKEFYEVQKGIDSSAPALKVFNDRYVPDSVRDKYALPDDWSTHSSAVQEASPDEKDLSKAPVSLIPEISGEDPDERLIVISQPKDIHTIESWRARKGENIRDVLRRWSDRKKVELMWASPNTPDLQKDFSFFGNFQDAVNGLLKEAGGDSLHSQFRSEGLNPVMMSAASTVTTNLPVPDQESAQSTGTPVDMVSEVFKPQPAEKGTETRWFGLSGAPLGEVLQVWGEQAGYSVIWQAEGHYALKESISEVGTFEDAVYRALSQYDNDSVRPVGEIYTDQNSGQKVLVISTDAS